MFLDLLGVPISLLISQTIIGYILYRLGFFKWVEHTIVFAAEESEKKLVGHLLIFLMLLTIFTNVYISMIISFTIINDLCERIKLSTLKIIKLFFLSSLIIELSSLLSPYSSLNNLLYIKATGIEYSDFISKFLILGLASITGVFLLIYFIAGKKLLRFKNREIIDPDIYIKDWHLLNLCFLDILVIQISYFSIGFRSGIIYLVLFLQAIFLVYSFFRGQSIPGMPAKKGYLFMIRTIVFLYILIYIFVPNENHLNLSYLFILEMLFNCLYYIAMFLYLRHGS